MPLIAPFYPITRSPKEVAANNAESKQIEVDKPKTSPSSRQTVDTHSAKGGRFQGLPLELNIANDGVWDSMCSTEYVGVYYLNTTGKNAGYYVNKTGNVRFPASTSRSTMICSSSYRVYFEDFPFASEIETGGGSWFSKRDDFIFCKNNSIKSASFCGTKFSIRNGNMRGIGSVGTGLSSVSMYWQCAEESDTFGRILLRSSCGRVTCFWCKARGRISEDCRVTRNTGWFLGNR